MKVLSIQGMNSLYAAQAAHKLLFGLKMLPQYMGESYEEFVERLDAMPDKDKETMIREAAVFVKLEEDELLDLAQYAADANGVPYTKENMKSLKPEDIHEIVVLVSMQVFREHKIRLLSESEKKN